MAKATGKWSKQVLVPEDYSDNHDSVFFEATSGRQGPVSLDIPMDAECALIENSKTPRLQSEEIHAPRVKPDPSGTKFYTDLNQAFAQSERSLIHTGVGIRCANAQHGFHNLLKNSRAQASRHYLVRCVTPHITTQRRVYRKSWKLMGELGRWQFLFSISAWQSAP